MKLTITFRHIEPTESLKAHVEDKLEKVKKFLIKPIEAHVILSVEKFRQQCEITISAKDFKGTALETSDNLYASIDQAAHKIERQLQKHKDILKEHHKHHLPIHTVAQLAEDEVQKESEIEEVI